MSNARSPREVCSTTIGTSGLIVLASFASSAGFLPNVATVQIGSGRLLRVLRTVARHRLGSAPGRPQLPGAALARFLLRRPQLVSRLGLLDADGLCLAHEQLQRLLARHLLAHPLQAIGLAQLLEEFPG